MTDGARGRRWTRAAALALGAVVPAACGRDAPAAIGATPSALTDGTIADIDGALRRADERRRDADATQARADAKRDEGDRHLAAGALQEARMAFLAAGRLYEAADRERNDAYDAAAAVRAAWAAGRAK